MYRSGLSVAECRCPFGRSTLVGPLPSWKQEAFPAIVRLQKVANHLLLLSPDSLDDKDKQLRDKQYQDIAYGEDYEEIRRLCSVGDQSALCGKITVLKSILEKMRRAHRKVLLFSHGTRTLDLLESFLRTEGFSWERMDGTVPVMHRQKLVDKFSLNPAKLVFLLSTKASSLGFNLPAASAVVLFEPDWNPSQDLQAQDRAYRIGQTAHTSVYRLVSAGTVEEMMYDRQIYKHQMAVVALDGQCTRRYFDGVAGMKGQEGELWGMANLFKFNPTDSVMTDKIIKRATKAEERIAKLDTQLDSGSPDGSKTGIGDSNGFMGNGDGGGVGGVVVADDDDDDDDISGNDFYYNHKKTKMRNDSDLFVKLFDPKFVEEESGGDSEDDSSSNKEEEEGGGGENKGENGSDKACNTGNSSSSSSGLRRRGSMFEEINLDDCDGVVYSVKHNDVVVESKVERELSDRAQMRVEHQQRNALRNAFITMSATQGTQWQRRSSVQTSSQSIFASVPMQAAASGNSSNSSGSYGGRTVVGPRSMFGSMGSGFISSSGNNSSSCCSSGCKRVPHSLDVITIGVPRKLPKK